MGSQASFSLGTLRSLALEIYKYKVQRMYEIRILSDFDRNVFSARRFSSLPQILYCRQDEMLNCQGMAILRCLFSATTEKKLFYILEKNLFHLLVIFIAKL